MSKEAREAAGSKGYFPYATVMYDAYRYNHFRSCCVITFRAAAWAWAVIGGNLEVFAISSNCRIQGTTQSGYSCIISTDFSIGEVNGYRTTYVITSNQLIKTTNVWFSTIVHLSTTSYCYHSGYST